MLRLADQSSCEKRLQGRAADGKIGGNTPLAKAPRTRRRNQRRCPLQSRRRRANRKDPVVAHGDGDRLAQRSAGFRSESWLESNGTAFFRSIAVPWPCSPDPNTLLRYKVGKKMGKKMGRKRVSQRTEGKYMIKWEVSDSFPICTVFLKDTRKKDPEGKMRCVRIKYYRTRSKSNA